MSNWETASKGRLQPVGSRTPTTPLLLLIAKLLLYHLTLPEPITNRHRYEYRINYAQKLVDEFSRESSVEVQFQWHPLK